MNLDECFQKALLKKVPASKEKAMISLESAKEFLEDSEANFAEERYEAALVLAYIAALNAVKALLFKEGVSEASHYCAVLYLRERHNEIGELIETFNTFRIKRHSTQYFGLSANEFETEEYLKFTKRFIDIIEKEISH